VIESQPVPAIDLGRPVPPLARLIVWRCHSCEMPFAAESEAGLLAALDAHARYVNTTADRATDPHFFDVRADALLAS
jgi:hypothetical protein